MHVLLFNLYNYIFNNTIGTIRWPYEGTNLLVEHFCINLKVFLLVIIVTLFKLFQCTLITVSIIFCIKLSNWIFLKLVAAYIEDVL